jgi:hypothetical protein
VARRECPRLLVSFDAFDRCVQFGVGQLIQAELPVE